ncbi:MULTISPECIES: MBL fold metallo-hydrolase [Brevibacillus]|uniref:ComEC/Rec2 family competence protein n=1 Tax=Brevibacillus TaxID=55080 RepID=UPI002041445D|nr:MULTISPECIES: MBL fold metallo-hydrolase [Brevibacillus]MCM3077854.1 MBL fold metallo-hydrolase [Brevibacillus invocatus]MCM3428072.1 MBL fold metallo-hydrolase [Brevibacillus invocatus]MDH4616057.1 MBL fold metallo-hydrolase [Brevibacillus sp. AY1]
MLGKTGWIRFFLGLCVILLISCSSVDSRFVQEVIKVDDPFASENERDFTGLVITYFALPHGESTLIRLPYPKAKTILIDTGSEEDWPVLQERLLERHVTRLDYVVLTNDQPEHAGGYPFLAEKLVIDKLIVPKLIEPVIRHAVSLKPDQKRLDVTDNQVLELDDEVSIRALSPNEPLFLSPQNNSLVFQLRHLELNFLFTSGINEKAEERLLERHANELKSVVLKVGDQGSNQASSQPFLTQVDPQVAIIQTGKTREEMKDNQTEVLERLGESWAETYLTSQDGSITILSNGKDYRVLKQQ